MEPKTAELLSEVALYFENRIEQYGTTALGVDWNSEDRQRLSFRQIARLFERDQGFSVNDVGCGYGAFCGFVDEHYRDVSYFGYDISEAMIRGARSQYGNRPGTEFHRSHQPTREATYSIASGVFNVRLGCDDDRWRALITATLDAMFEHSTDGFAFNCLTTYADADKLKSRLFYADPLGMFDLCKRRYSRDVALLHDYGAYEFTMIVRKRDS